MCKRRRGHTHRHQAGRPRHPGEHVSRQLELAGTPAPVRLVNERGADALEAEQDVSTCTTDEARRASIRRTLLGLAGRDHALGLAGQLFRDHGELARVALRRTDIHQWTRQESRADDYLERAGVPTEIQVDLIAVLP